MLVGCRFDSKLLGRHKPSGIFTERQPHYTILVERLEDTLKWRRSYKPHKITPDDIMEESLTGKIYVNGFDATGRPIRKLFPAYNDIMNMTISCSNA